MALKLLAGRSYWQRSLNKTSCDRSTNTKCAQKPSQNAPLDTTWSDTDKTHLSILRMGVAIWNRWRIQDPLTTPQLINADLTGLDLENANFCRTNLSGANLSGCYLYDADFQKANLSEANLSRAGLIGANFHEADLSDANLSRAYLAQSDLSSANLARACLRAADLHSALLTQTIFRQAYLAQSVMTNCLDLTLAQLKSAQDAHLSFCPVHLKAQLDAGSTLRADDSDETATRNDCNAEHFQHQPHNADCLKRDNNQNWPVSTFCPVA